MHAGILAPAGVAEARDEALRQVRALQPRVGELAAALTVLPEAVGVRSPRTYLLAVLNPAELRPSGGAPLSIALLRFDKGRMTIENRGQTAELTRDSVQENPPLTWDGLARDPWFPRFADRFANAAMSPDWPTSAEELRRAYAAQFRTDRPAGVIALDAVGLAELLRATGPIEAPGYGTLTSENLVQTLLVDAYADFDTPFSQGERRALNNRLVDMMIDRLTKGDRMLEMAKALGRAAQGERFRLYFRNPTLQRAVASHGMDGALTRAPHDYLGVFTKNGNGSKLDVFEQREIHQLVRLRRDGTVRVTRTVSISNAAPPSPFGRRYPAGYFSRLLKSLVVGYVPATAREVRLSLNGSQVPKPPTLYEGGFRVVLGSVELWPGESAPYEVSYTLPESEPRSTYALTADPQPLVRPSSLRIDVVAPPGEEFAGARNWIVKGGRARWSGELDRARTFTLRVAA
ncbi:MAG: DUF4012 domain-containing protein [Mycobacterium leprae]